MRLLLATMLCAGLGLPGCAAQLITKPDERLLFQVALGQSEVRDCEAAAELEIEMRAELEDEEPGQKPGIYCQETTGGHLSQGVVDILGKGVDAAADFFLRGRSVDEGR